MAINRNNELNLDPYAFLDEPSSYNWDAEALMDPEERLANSLNNARTLGRHALRSPADLDPQTGEIRDHRTRDAKAKHVAEVKK